MEIAVFWTHQDCWHSETIDLEGSDNNLLRILWRILKTICSFKL